MVPLKTAFVLPTRLPLSTVNEPLGLTVQRPVQRQRLAGDRQRDGSCAVGARMIARLLWPRERNGDSPFGDDDCVGPRGATVFDSICRGIPTALAALVQVMVEAWL